jgi:uncharacterized protein involved in exopolysaccharide biosynthesis
MSKNPNFRSNDTAPLTSDNIQSQPSPRAARPLSTPAAFPTSGDPAAAPGAGISKLALIQRILVQRWKLVLAAFVVCGLIGVGFGLAFGRDQYLAQGILQFEPLPVPDVPRVYTPPTFDMVANDEYVKSSRNLEQLSKRQNLQIPPVVFRRLIALKKPFNENTIEVSLQWSDPQQGADIVNTLMDVHVEQVVAGRKESVENALKNAENVLVRTKAERKEAKSAYDAFADRENVRNITKGLEELKTKIANEESPLDSAKRDLVALQKNIASVQDKIELEKKKAKEEGQKASQVKLADLKRTLTKEKGALDEAESDLRKAEADYQSAAKGSVAQVELAAKQEDVRKLKKRVANLKESVKQIEQQIETERENPSTPQVADAQRELESLRRQEEASQVKIQEMQKKIDGLQQRARKLTVLQKEADPLEKRLEEAEAAVKDAGVRYEQLRILNDAKHREFRIVAAVPSYTAASNTFKKFFLTAFAIPFVLFLGFVVVRDLRSSEWQAEILAGQLSLPVLARCTRTVAGQTRIDPAEARGLALRLRQYVSSAGGTVLVSSINDGSELDDLLANVGRFLAVRDERVLIIDSRISRAEPAALVRQVERPVEVISGEAPAPTNAGPGLSGLVQYLVFEGHNLKDFIHPTGLGAVDFLPAGGPYPLTDVLASEPMKELIDRMRKQYSVVLIAGPALTQTTDTEILAAYVQGMIVLVNGMPSGGVPLNDFFQSLRDANARLLGAVI